MIFCVMTYDRGTPFSPAKLLASKFLGFTLTCCGHHWPEEEEGLRVSDRLRQRINEYVQVPTHHVHDKQEKSEDGGPDCARQNLDNGDEKDAEPRLG